MFLNLIIKNSDDSYFYLFKLLSNKYKYVDSIDEYNINNLVFNKIDNLGYIKDSKINIEELFKKCRISRVFIEEETIYSNKLFNKYNIKYTVLNKNSYFINEINKLKGVILLKYILDDNKQSIYNLNFLIIGDNSLSSSIKTLLSPLVSYDSYNKDVVNLNLNKYDVIINTSCFKINPELLFNVKNNLIIYDLEINSNIDRNLLNNTFIKYRYINNVSLYLPMAKASIINEVMCENEGL